MYMVNSYFSGAGLCDLGLSLSGLQIQQSFEIDKTCCETLRVNFNHEIIEGDITLKCVADDLECDVMVATYPCTKYSAIADIHRARTGDDLFLHFFRHLAIRKPEVYLLENVPGMKKFPVVMEAMSKLPEYYVNIFCPVNATTWLPQERQRLILFGTKKPFQFRPPEEPVRKKSLLDILEEEPEVKITKSIINRMTGKYRDKPIISDPEAGDVAPTCVAHYHKDRSTRLLRDCRYEYGVRPYTVREYARLQGVPDSFEFSGTENQQYKQIGNGVAVDMAIWAGREIIRYLEA